MRRTIVPLVLALTSLAWTAGGASAITYGQPDGDLHPNVGMLVAEIDGEKDWICSGTLISPTVFLTAAHCIVYLESIDTAAHDVWVTFDQVFAETDTFLRGTFHRDERYLTPPSKDPHDIAVVVLDAAVANIEPAELPAANLLSESRSTLRGETFTAVGYGAERVSQQGGSWGYTGGGERRYVSQSYTTLKPYWLQLSMNPATGNGGTCFGDSGGPHFLGGANSNLIVSITVTGDAMCKATDLTYRLDTASARDFLDDYVTL